MELKCGSEIVNQNDTLQLDYLLNVANQLNISIWSFVLQTKKVSFFTKGIMKIYEIESKDFTENTWKTCIHADDYFDVVKKRKRLLQGEVFYYSYRIVTKKGTVKWIQDHTIPITNKNGKIVQFVSFINDITKTKSVEKNLQNLAYYDEITQVPNRYYAREIIKKWLEENQRKNKTFALFFLSLDNFYRISDTFGHEFGDEIINQTVQRVSETIQEKAILCRLDGDELLILVKNQQKQQNYNNFAEKIIDIIEQPISVNGYEIYLSVSIGISIFPNDGGDIVSLVKKARSSLNHAKQIGRHHIYSSSMGIETFKLFQLEVDLRNALSKSELYLVYQPRVDARTHHITGAEALARWQHPSLGIVTPNEFIPLVEVKGLIQQFNKFVIETVCMQINEWKKQRITFTTISFNLSAKSFLTNNIVDYLSSSIKRFGISPSLLEIEITEDSLLQPLEIVQTRIKKIKEMGIKIAVDDYGTGYSSINNLKNFAVDTIKIDRSFIQDIINNDVDMALVKSMIDLSKALKKKIVAEGVEAKEQLDLLNKLGCDEIQGYLFSKPVSSDEMRILFFKKHIDPQVPSGKPVVERRKLFRVELPKSLSAQITIKYLGEKHISLGTTEILVRNIGPGGLRCVSHLRLPYNNIIYGIKIFLLGEEVEINGKIVWSQEVEIGLFEYGIKFIIEDSEQQQRIVSLMNMLAIKIRNNTLEFDNMFITDPPILYMKKKYL